MAHLHVSSLLSADGIFGDPQSWANRYFDADAVQSSLDHLQEAEAMLMGRNTYEYFAPVWAGGGNPYLDRINAIDKYVFSATLTPADATWDNAHVVSSDPMAKVAELKATSEGPLIVYGCGRFAMSLLDAGLVDRFELWVNPELLGDGARVPPVGARRRLELVDVVRRRSGVVGLIYAPDATSSSAPATHSAA
jgi:dihydrofolate reductase